MHRFNEVRFESGTQRDLAFLVASRRGTSTRAAGLTMTVQNLVGTENGCDSNAEAFAESNGTSVDKSDPESLDVEIAPPSRTQPV